MGFLPRAIFRIGPTLCLSMASIISPGFAQAARPDTAVAIIPWTYSGASEELAQARVWTLLAVTAVAQEVAHSYRVPKLFHITAQSCGRATAFYEPAHHQVVVCYELARELADLTDEFARVLNLRAHIPDRRSNAIAALRFGVYHEVAHGLIHEFGLPVAGGEEIAADQFAFLRAAEAETHPTEIHAMGRIFTVLALRQDERSFLEVGRAMADLHTLPAQRAANLECWEYGSNVEMRALYAEEPPEMQEALLPAERRNNCVAECERMRNSWNDLLLPFARASRVDYTGLVPNGDR